MKLKGIYRNSNPLTALLFVLVIILSALLVNNYISQNSNELEKAHDAIRIADIDNIHQAINDYYVINGMYPTCLYKADCSKALEGTSIMPSVATDPVTHLGYSYASFGKNGNCQGYHLGSSLERTGSQALLTGADSVPQPDSALCVGSKPDFSGLSYAPGGQPCNAKAGIAAPSDEPNAETCFDLERIRPASTPTK